MSQASQRNGRDPRGSVSRNEWDTALPRPGTDSALAVAGRTLPVKARSRVAVFGDGGGVR